MFIVPVHIHLGMTVITQTNKKKKKIEEQPIHQSPPITQITSQGL